MINMPTRMWGRLAIFQWLTGLQIHVAFSLGPTAPLMDLAPVDIGVHKVIIDQDASAGYAAVCHVDLL